MTTPPDDLTEAELAAWQYEHREELDAQSAHDENVEVEYARPMSTTVSFRLPVAEAAAITKAAERAGVSRSDWIRHACTAAVTGSPAVPREVAKTARQLADDLSLTERHIRALLNAIDSASVEQERPRASAR